MRIAAGFSALTTRPGGNMMSSARNAPSLIGSSSAEVRHLTATWQHERLQGSLLVLLIFAFVPPAERSRLADYTPDKRNLSKKHRVYRFTRPKAALG